MLKLIEISEVLVNGGIPGPQPCMRKAQNG